MTPRVRLLVTDVNMVPLFDAEVEIGAKASEVALDELGGSRRPLLIFLRAVERPDPLADYRPVYLTDGGVTDEAALLDRVLFLLGKLVSQ